MSATDGTPLVRVKTEVPDETEPPQPCLLEYQPGDSSGQAEHIWTYSGPADLQQPGEHSTERRMASRRKSKNVRKMRVEEEHYSGDEEPRGDDDDEEEGPAGGPGYKVEDAIADFYEANPLFYDKGDPEYKNKEKKAILLEKFSNLLGMGIKPEDIARKFKSHRTEYVRLKRIKKGKYGLLTSLQRWKLERYQFLDPFCISRTEDTGSVGNADGAEEGLEEEAEDDGETVAGTSTGGTTSGGYAAVGPKSEKRPYLNGNTITSIKKRAATPSSMSDILANLKSLHDSDQEKTRAQQEVETVARETTQEPVDERVAWGQWLMSSCLRIPSEHFQQYQRDTFEATLRWLPREPVTPARPLLGPTALPPPQRYNTPNQGYMLYSNPIRHNRSSTTFSRRTETSRQYSNSQ
ncbi:uncharacterized protein LOC144867428 [Branchiostoma floridae x Branchiostoma japonicum]